MTVTFSTFFAATETTPVDFGATVTIPGVDNERRVKNACDTRASGTASFASA
jgi:hypothetical protein